MLESKISKLAREENDIDTKSSILTNNIKEYLKQIIMRQAEADVRIYKHVISPSDLKQVAFITDWLLYFFFCLRLICP